MNSGFIRKMYEIQDKLIQEIQSQRRTMFLAGDLEQQHQTIVERMYFDSDAECITGKQAHDLYQRLRKKPTEVDEKLSTALLEQFAAETAKAIDRLRQIKQDLLRQYANGAKVEAAQPK